MDPSSPLHIAWICFLFYFGESRWQSTTTPLSLALSPHKTLARPSLLAPPILHAAKIPPTFGKMTTKTTKMPAIKRLWRKLRVIKRCSAWTPLGCLRAHPMPNNPSMHNPPMRHQTPPTPTHLHAQPIPICLPPLLLRLLALPSPLLALLSQTLVRLSQNFTPRLRNLARLSQILARLSQIPAQRHPLPVLTRSIR